MNNFFRLIAFIALIFSLVACTSAPVLTPTATPQSTLTSNYTKEPSPTPMPTETLRPTQFPTITPSPTPSEVVTRYHIELGVETFSSKVWMPAPRYWDGKGIRRIQYLEISPQPKLRYREETGSEVLHWVNRSGGKQVYKIVFDVEMVFVDNSEAARLKSSPYDKNSYIYHKYTQPQKDIQSDADEIIDLAMSIIGNETNPYKQARLIHRWMTINIRSGSVPRDALSTLHNKGNDCAGKAHLFITLCRAIGIPARNVAGIHIPNSKHLRSGNWWPDRTMGYHVWAEFYLSEYGWVQVDPGRKDMFGVIEEHRIITSKGNDLKLGFGFPRSEIAWFHLPYDTNQQIEREPLWFNVSEVP